MRTLQERNFHLLMGGLLATSFVIDPAMRAVLDDWNPPSVSLFTFAIGFVWVARYVMWRAEVQDRTERELRERIERLEQRQAMDHAAAEAASRDRRARGRGDLEGPRS